MHISFLNLTIHVAHITTTDLLVHDVLFTSCLLPGLVFFKSSAHPNMILRSFDDMFGWASQNSTLALGAGCADPVGSLSSSLRALGSVSSAFSGVCAEAVCISHLEAEVNTCVDAERVAALPHLFCIDKDRDCRTEQLCLPQPPACQFGDILGFASPSLNRSFKLMAEPYDFDKVVADATQPGATLLTSKCTKCKCTCKLQRAGFHQSGSPCTDFTTWGKGRRLKGPTVLGLAIWIAQRIQLLELFILFENVPGFPSEVLHRYLSRWYNVAEVRLCGTEVGLPVRRPRKYIAMTLKTIAQLTRPLQDVAKVFAKQRDASLTWRAFMQATEPELDCELVWARQRVHISPDPSLEPRCEADFLRSMLDAERERLQVYKAVHSVDRCVCNLTQDPHHVRAASKEDVLHTFVCNCNVMWATEFGRWMTAREMLLGMLFPVTNAALRAAQPRSEQPVPLCSFNQSRVRLGLPARDRTAMAHQTGNGVCVAAMGSVLQWAFINLDLSQNSVSVPAPIQALQDREEQQRCISDAQLVVWSAKKSSSSSSDLQESQHSDTQSSSLECSTSCSPQSSAGSDAFLAAWRSSRGAKRSLSSQFLFAGSCTEHLKKTRR